MKALRFIFASLILTFACVGFGSCGSSDSDLEGATEVHLIYGSALTDHGKGMIFVTDDNERKFFVKGDEVIQIPYRSEVQDDVNLEKLTVPRKFKFEGETFVPIRIGKKAFCEYEKLVEVKLPNSIKEIDERAFAGCINLTKVNLPDSLIFLGYRAFANCHKLEKIVLPSTLDCINNAAFVNCGFKEINLPHSIEEIRYKAFAGCKNLTKVVLSNPNIKINGEAFDECENLDKSNLIDKMK